MSKIAVNSFAVILILYGLVVLYADLFLFTPFFDASSLPFSSLIFDSFSGLPYFIFSAPLIVVGIVIIFLYNKSDKYRLLYQAGYVSTLVLLILAILAYAIGPKETLAALSTAYVLYSIFLTGSVVLGASIILHVSYFFSQRKKERQE